MCIQTNKQLINKAHKNTKKGFTLAEVLVTLAIIGTVAALTIPSLIQNVQEQQNKVAFKKIYSSIEAATLSIKDDYGGTLVGAFSDPDGGGPLSIYDDARDKYLTYLSWIKKCNTSAADSSACSLGSSSAKYLNGTGFTDNSSLSRAILSNGAILNFKINDSSCQYNPGFGGEFTQLIICGNINIDVNGFKPPNTMGKDMFSVWIVRTGTGIKPNGVPNDGYSSCTSNSFGEGCAYKVLTNTDY